MGVKRILAIAVTGCTVLMSHVAVPKINDVDSAAASAGKTSYNITGYLSAGAELNPSQSSILNEGIMVEVQGAGNTKTDEKGYFQLENVPGEQEYSIKMSKQGYLSREVKGVKLTGDIEIGSGNSPVLIWAGDLNQDGAINITDVMLIATAFNTVKTGAGFNEVCDINKDGAINISDIMALVKYFNKSVTDYPEVEIITTDTPVVTDNPYAGWDSEHSSYATYTGSGYSGGCAELDPIPSDMEITALNPTDYNSFGVNSALAGAYLKVTGSKGSTVVYVTDLYPEGAPGACDLCPTSFAKIGDMLDGKINIKWHIVKAPITGNFSYRIKEGSSPNWAAIQVRNHIYPVLKMEYYENGNWISMEKMPWNHFVANGIGTTTPRVRITDIRGYTVEDTIESLPQGGDKPSYIVPGNVQFPD